MPKGKRKGTYRIRKPRSDAKLPHLPGESPRQYAARVERERLRAMSPTKRAEYYSSMAVRVNRYRQRQKLAAVLERIHQRQEEALQRFAKHGETITPTGRVHTLGSWE
jgi:uncharacterized protein with PIN domain